MATVTLYEDNAGRCYIARDGADVAWDVTPVIDESDFAGDAAALAAGDTADWTVEELPVGDLGAMPYVAEYDSTTDRVTLRTHHNGFSGGSAARDYLGLPREDKVTTPEAAEWLGVTRKRVWAMIEAGRLPAHKYGRDYLISVADLLAVKDRQPGRPRKRTDPI